MPSPSPNRFDLILGPHPVRPETALPSLRKYDRNREVSVCPAKAGSTEVMVVSGVIGLLSRSKSVQTASRSERASPSSSQPTITLPFRPIATPRLSVLELLMVSDVLT